MTVYHIITYNNSIEHYCHCTILYYIVLYCTILYYLVLYCTILYMPMKSMFHHLSAGVLSGQANSSEGECLLAISALRFLHFMNRSRQEKRSGAGLTEGQARQPWPLHSNFMWIPVQLSTGVLSGQANSSEGDAC